MLTLGIHDGHTSTACLFEDGEVLACISEDRLNRDKEWTGFPELAARKCLEISDKSAGDVDAVGICSHMPQIGHPEYMEPALYKRLFGLAVRFCPQGVLQDSRNIHRAKSVGDLIFRKRKAALQASVANMGVSTPSIHFYEHHELHAATAYFLSWYRDRTSLVMTLDGSGDAVCATVNVAEQGEIRRVSEVFNYNSICDFYTRVTHFLGMKPMSHEYKVMGMAAYASDYGKEEVVNILRSYFSIDPKDPLKFVNNAKAWKWQFQRRLERDLKWVRFDVLCGAIQDLFEEVVLAWVKNAIQRTGISDVVVSGGGFMNVKLNYKVCQLPEVDSLFVLPSCGDESNPIGACILSAIQNGYPFEHVKPLGMIYWGPEYSNDDCKKAIDAMLVGNSFQIEKCDDVNATVAKQIADGKVVGRFCDRMEWGARALGNRSILADPRKQQIIHKINKAIKMRDFWMPFAPSILREYRERYVALRPDYRCPYMTVAPNSREEAWDTITAGLHPFDRTTRCQIVDPENHPNYYDLVSKYEKLTGVGGILNTSFNLHGDPIVCTPEDAIRTFLKSDLEVLQLEDYVVEKI